MPNVVSLTRVRNTDTCEELVRVLEGALAQVRAGRLRSLVAVVMDERGQECVLVTGAYRKHRGYISNAGFKLQTMAADSHFG